MPMRKGVTWNNDEPSHPVPYIPDRSHNHDLPREIIDVLSEHLSCWRWFMDRPDPRVEQRAFIVAERRGYLERDGRSGPELAHPGGGQYFTSIEHNGSIVWSNHLAAAFGHWLPGCESCGLPIECRDPEARPSMCFSCNYWINTLKPLGLMIVEQPDGERWSYQDCGRRETRNTSGLGFGGQEFTFQALNGGKVTSTNNVFTQGSVPRHLYQMFPPTHVILR